MMTTMNPPSRSDIQPCSTACFSSEPLSMIQQRSAQALATAAEEGAAEETAAVAAEEEEKESPHLFACLSPR